MEQQVPNFSAMEQSLINDFQRDLPIESRPYAYIADSLGVEEKDVLEILRRFKASGIVARVGPVFAPNSVGVSTLAAIAVNPDSVTQVAGLVNQFPEVNHNYEREHEFNLWFVITASSSEHLQQVINQIETKTGHSVLVLPMLKDYFIDLAFPIDWEQSNDD